MNISFIHKMRAHKSAAAMPSAKSTIMLGFEHVLIMFMNNLIPAVLVSCVAGVGAGTGYTANMVYLIQMSIFFAGVATLIQAVGIGPFGARLPLLQGASFAYLPIIILPILFTELTGLGSLMLGVIIGGVLTGLLGLIIRPVRINVPPLVMGLVVLILGLTMVEVGVKYVAGMIDYKGMTHESTPAKNWGPALVVILVASACKLFSKGLVSKAAVLIAVLAGQLVATLLGHTHGNERIVETDWLSFPVPFAWGFEWNTTLVVGVCIGAIISFVETSGTLRIVTVMGEGRVPTQQEKSGVIYGNGLSNIVAGIFGGLPSTSYSSNAYHVVVSANMSRYVMVAAALILIILGLIPKVGAFISTMPHNILGGAMIVIFSSVCISGIRILDNIKWTLRSKVITALSLGIGFGIKLFPQIFQSLPETLESLICSAIVPACLLAIILNIVIPNRTVQLAGESTSK